MNDQFIKFGLSPELNKGLDKMGFQTPTQVQEAAILPMLDGQDLLVQAPTGTGKTCAFGIPAVEMAKPGVHYVQTVILCPTRELAVQTATVLK
ncbi:DEAD/DEAH box helicase, partial [Anaerotruncus rubiinfantis]